MGNSLGGKKTAKVMKIDGQVIKFKTPVHAGEVVKDYPGHVLLESEAVKHFGIRAKPLEAEQELKPKRLYFLVVLPKSPDEKLPRRVRSGINMSAKDRLESLMLSRRSVSDLTIMKPASIVQQQDPKEGSENGAMRVRMRLPKAEVEKLMKESKDEAEAAEKIMDLCIANSGGGGGGAGGAVAKKGEAHEGVLLRHQQACWNGGDHARLRDGFKVREVCFLKHSSIFHAMFPALHILFCHPFSLSSLLLLLIKFHQFLCILTC